MNFVIVHEPLNPDLVTMNADRPEGSGPGSGVWGPQSVVCGLGVCGLCVVCRGRRSFDILVVLSIECLLSP